MSAPRLTDPRFSDKQRRRMALTAGLAAAAVLGMTGAAFAAVPLYDLFCKVTGYGGETQTAETASSVVLDRTISVRFDTNIAGDLPIAFEPLQASETLRIGETGMARFRVRNLSDHPVRMSANFNVAPFKAGQYFRKLECFCFQDQTLAAREEAEFPVVYYVDPELARDFETQELTALTLSYTYFSSLDEAAGALAQADTDSVSRN